MVESIGLSGGGERLARETTKALDPDRFERTLCVTRWKPSTRNDPAVRAALAGLEEAGVAFLGLARSSRLQLWAWRPVVRILREERIDILHGHMFGSNVWAAILGTLSRTPVIVAHEHTWSFEGKPLRRFLDRNLIARRSSAFIAVTAEDRRRMVEIEKIGPEDVIVIPNGIPAPPSPTDTDIRAELGIEPNSPLVGSIGELRAQKRFDVLIRAAVQLRPLFPGLRVVIAGEGAERQALEQLIEELEMGGIVTLVGQRNDVPDLLAAFDVAVNCSDFEGAPLSIMEYMEAALPIVATCVGGVPEMIDEGVSGLLVEPGEPESIAAAVAEILANPERAAAMGAEGQRRRGEEFDLVTMTRRLESLYEDLLAERGIRL